MPFSFDLVSHTINSLTRRHAYRATVQNDHAAQIKLCMRRIFLSRLHHLVDDSAPPTRAATF